MKKLLTSTVFFLVSLAIFGQSLAEFQQLAAENNPGLQASYKKFEAAMQEASQTRSMPDPQLSFGYFISPVETRVGPQVARFSLNQMFPWFGTLSAKGNASALMAKARYQSFIDSRNNLFYKVAKAYYELSELEELIDIQVEYLTILESYKSIANGKYENDKGSMVDVIRADMNIDEAKTKLEILRRRRKPTRAELNLLLNRDRNEKIKVTDSLSLNAVEIESNEQDSLFKGHPKLEELDMKAKAMEEKRKAALKQGYPSFGVGVDYVLVEERSNIDLPDNGKNVLMPMVSISLPVFRGKYRSARKEAQLLRDSYQRSKKEKANQLLIELEKARFQIDKNQQQIELYRSQIKQTESALNLLFSSYSNQGNEFEELLRMQQQLLNYNELMIQGLKALFVTRAEVDYITAKDYQYEIK